MVVISVEKSAQILKLYNAVTRIENMMKNNSFWISFFFKTLMKTPVEETFFSIVTLYWQGPKFISTKLEMVNLDKLLDLEINFESLS